MKKLLLTLCLGLLFVGIALVILLKNASVSENPVVPTLMVLPSLTFTSPPTATTVPTASVEPTRTIIPANEVALVSTNTPTLSVRVLEISAVMGDHDTNLVLTPLPTNATVIPAPPLPYEPLPDATSAAPPFTDWYSFESDYPSAGYAPAWTRQLAQGASRGQYHRSEQVGSRARFPFTGQGLRVRYVAAQNMGIFEIRVDGALLDRIDAYAENLQFLGTDVYTLAAGDHVLELVVTGEKSARSSGHAVGLDAIQVYQTNETTLIIPPQLQELAAIATPRPAARIELVSAPPTLQPTLSPVSPRVMNPSVLIAYDENGNRSIDPAEGVAGISVRIVESNTNRVLASTTSDARGYAGFELVSDVPARLVVPYFGQSWDLTSGGNASAFTLLLTPGNQPGLIP